MKYVLALLAFASAPAFADGFTCVNTENAVVAKVYNQTQPALGTRNAAVMVLSNYMVGDGNKTIARFQAVNGVLTNDAAEYTAKVDHRFNDSGRKGELIGGTNIGNLQTIVLNIGFSYAAPLTNGSHVAGMLVLVRRNGATIRLPVDCVRYLKN